MKKYAMAWRNTEVRAYFAIIAGSTLIITLNILGMFPTAFDAFHHAFFAVSSVITTTGFSTTDFDLWPQLSRCILVLLMIVGACAGSTGGGVKVSRLVILCKALGSELRKLLHPRSVRVLTVDGKPVSRETVQGVQSYMTLYFLVTLVFVLLVALDNLDFVTTFTAVLATLNNIGPGLGLVGPTGCFAAFFAAGEDRADAGYAVRAAGAVPHADPADALDLAEIFEKRRMDRIVTDTIHFLCISPLALPSGELSPQVTERALCLRGGRHALEIISALCPPGRRRPAFRQGDSSRCRRGRR